MHKLTCQEKCIIRFIYQRKFLSSFYDRCVIDAKNYVNIFKLMIKYGNGCQNRDKINLCFNIEKQYYLVRR